MNIWGSYILNCGIRYVWCTILAAESAIYAALFMQRYLCSAIYEVFFIRSLRMSHKIYYGITTLQFLISRDDVVIKIRGLRYDTCPLCFYSLGFSHVVWVGLVALLVPPSFWGSVSAWILLLGRQEQQMVPLIFSLNLWLTSAYMKGLMAELNIIIVDAVAYVTSPKEWLGLK